MLCALALAASLLFPNVQARTLTGQAVETRQQHATPVVYLIGFTPDSRTESRAWKRALAGSELRVIEMPVLSGFAVFIRPVIEGSMARKTPEPDRPYMQITTDRETLVTGLRLADPDRAAAVVLVDAQGAVRYTTRGGPTPETESALRAAWDELKSGR